MQFASDPAGAGLRGYRIFERCFQKGALVRCSGDTLALSPPLTIDHAHIDRLLETLAAAIREVA